MRTFVAVFVAALATGVAAELVCEGTSPGFDSWCNINCNHVKPFCPPSYCSCVDTEPAPSSSPAPVGGDSCRSNSFFVPDSWCNMLCNHEPPFCPSGYCTCADVEEVDAITVSHNEPGCCDGNDVEVYYIENFNLHTLTLDHEANIITESSLCKTFLGPSDVELDENRHIYVADPVAGTLTHIMPDCGAANIITSWTYDGVIDSPTAITVAEGGLYVAGKTRVYFVELDENYEAASITETGMTVNQVEAMDVAPDGTIFFVQRGAEVLTYDPDTGSVDQYFSVNQHLIPDIKDIKVSACGAYISVTDSNQIWRCSDLTDGSTCEIICMKDMTNLDSSSCMELNNPFGLSVDCYCNLYTAQRGNGQFVYLTNQNTSATLLFSHVISDGLYHPIDIEIYVSNDCAPSDSPSRTPSSTRSPSPSATPSPTPTSSRSASASPTPSPVFQLALRIDDYNTECVVGDCGINSTIALSQSQTTRKFGVITIIRHRVSTANTGSCDDVEDFDFVNNEATCLRYINPNTFDSFSAGMFEIYIRATSTGVNGAGGVPDFIIVPGIFGPETFPNADVSNTVIAAQVDCDGFSLQSFRFVWNGLKPCWNDAFFPGADTCVPLRNTPSSNPTQWENEAGTPLDGFFPFHEVVCPDTAGK